MYGIGTLSVNRFSIHANDEQLYENNFVGSDFILLLYRYILFNVDFGQYDGNN